MAATVHDALESSKPSITNQPTKITSVKALSELPGLTSIPPIYNSIASLPHVDQTTTFSEAENDPNIPVIDFFLLTSNNPDERFKTIQELKEACQDWGFSMVINHGVPESLMKAMIEAGKGFFELTEEEKQEYEGEHVLDPIRCGTSFNVSVEKVLYWMDFLKVFVHPKFHSPSKPAAFRIRQKGDPRSSKGVAKRDIGGVGLEENYIETAVNLENGFQILVGNLYPPCPQQELATGMPPHSDHGLLTLLIQNEIGGLQLQHKGNGSASMPSPIPFWSTLLIILRCLLFPCTCIKLTKQNKD